MHGDLCCLRRGLIKGGGYSLSGVGHWIPFSFPYWDQSLLAFYLSYVSVPLKTSVGQKGILLLKRMFKNLTFEFASKTHRYIFGVWLQSYHQELSNESCGPWPASYLQLSGGASCEMHLLPQLLQRSWPSQDSSRAQNLFAWICIKGFTE